jgi:hypothetical protein
MLNELSKRDDEWRKMALHISRDDKIADEITQRMYLKVYKYGKQIKFDSFYIYKALHSCFIDYMREAKIYSENGVDHLNLISNERTKEEILAYENLLSALDDELEKLHWYDREIVKIKNGKTLETECGRIDEILTGKPFRKIEAETEITITSLFNTVKTTKAKLRKKLQSKYNEWQQLKNH